MDLINGKATVVPAIWPIDGAGAYSGDICSLKMYNHCDVVVHVGAAPGGTSVMTFDKSAAVAAATVTLAFTRILRSGFVVDYTAGSAAFTVGETVTGGTSGGTGVVVEDTGSSLYMHTTNGTAFAAAETLTGGTSASTATSTSATKNEDILLPQTVASTFTIPAVANQTYVVPFDAADLGDGYTCLQVELGAASAGTIPLSAAYVLSEPRQAGEPMPTAIYD